MGYIDGLRDGWLSVGELDKIIAECRSMAMKLGFMLKWRIKKRTATAFITFNHNPVWKYEFTGNTPHMIICQMYCGVHAELTRRIKENHEAIIRMRIAEEERAKERAIANLPTWGDKRTR